MKLKYIKNLTVLMGIILLTAGTLSFLPSFKSGLEQSANQAVFEEGGDFLKIQKNKRNSFFAGIINFIDEFGIPIPSSVSKYFSDNFSGNFVLEETGAISESLNNDWWINSGGLMTESGGTAKTIQGDLDISNRWYEEYLSSNPNDTDNGIHPQNIFRLVQRSGWRDFSQEVYFKINKYNLSGSSNRNQSNGLLLFNRYQNGDSLYYAGIRVDGTAVIKKKINGVYYTMNQPIIFPGTYNKDTNPNLIPQSVWIGLHSEVLTASDNTVSIKLYMDNGKTGNWTLVAQAVDNGTDYGGAPILSSGYGGIRTDFMDVEFSDYVIEEIERTSLSSSSQASSLSSEISSLSSSFPSSSASESSSSVATSSNSSASSLNSSSSSFKSKKDSSSSSTQISSSSFQSSSISASSSSSSQSPKGKDHSNNGGGNDEDKGKGGGGGGNRTVFNSPLSSEPTTSSLVQSSLAVSSLDGDAEKEKKIKDRTNEVIIGNAGQEAENIKKETSHSSGNISLNDFISKKIAIGMNDERVKFLQSTLAKDSEIYPEGIITGFYGPLTVKAVQRFQKKYDLIANGSPDTTGFGLAGPRTRKKIIEVLVEKSDFAVKFPFSSSNSSESESNQKNNAVKQNIEGNLIISEEQVEILKKILIELMNKNSENANR